MQNRFWWIEMVRGVLTFAFGVLYLSFHIILYLLISLLGVYLLIDGCIDLFHIIKGKQTLRRHFSLYLGASASGSIGVLSLVDPHIVVVLIGLFFVLRIMVRGIQVFGEARRRQGQVAGLYWLYGMVLLIAGLICLLPTVFVFIPTFLTLFLGIYALGDGLYMLVRAWHLGPGAALFAGWSSKQPPSTRSLDIPAHLPSMTRRALIFLRRSGASGLGHIGWAFEWDNGWWNVGSVENYGNHAFAPVGQTDFWTTHTTNPVEIMLTREKAYDEYKVFVVARPQPKAAWKVVVWASRQPYWVVHRNCVDTTYDVLRAYGLSDLPDPVTEYAPNDWYDSLEGYSYSARAYSTLPLHLRQHVTRPLATQEIGLIIPKTLPGTIPSWRAGGSGQRGLIEIALIWQKMLHDVRAIVTLPGKWRKQRK